MEILPMPNGNYYIQITKNELPENNDYAGLCRRVLPDIAAAYFEVFPGEEGALIFARARSGGAVSMRFADIETLLAASEYLEEDTVSFLAKLSGEYVLVLYPWNRERLALALCDLADAAEVHPGYTRHLAEHGKMLLGPSAVSDLRRYFPAD
jgi:hypothetical protein